MSVAHNTLKIGDRCRLRVEWGNGSCKGKFCKILSFEDHGGLTFARVMWLGGEGKTLREEYGTQFTMDELVKV